MTNQKTKQNNKKQAKSVVLSWSDNAWDDYVLWQNEDPKIATEINNLIEECLKNPFQGTGKPEPLRGNLTGYWSRRITDKHRLVYLPEDNQIYIVMCKFHYK